MHKVLAVRRVHQVKQLFLAHVAVTHRQPGQQIGPVGAGHLFEPIHVDDGGKVALAAQQVVHILFGGAVQLFRHQLLHGVVDQLIQRGLHLQNAVLIQHKARFLAEAQKNGVVNRALHHGGEPRQIPGGSQRGGIQFGMAADKFRHLIQPQRLAAGGGQLLQPVGKRPNLRL